MTSLPDISPWLIWAFAAIGFTVTLVVLTLFIGLAFAAFVGRKRLTAPKAPELTPGQGQQTANP